MFSDVVDGSSSSPRWTQPFATRACSSGSRSFVARSFTNSTAMKQPTARTSPIAGYFAMSSRSPSMPAASSARTFSSTGSRSKTSKRGERRRARRRQPGPGRSGGHVVEVHRGLGAEHGADRHHAAAHRLAERHQVGLDAPALHGEHVAGATEPGLHLVDRQQEVELAAELEQRRPERVGRRDAAPRAHDRLDHEPGDLARVDRVEEQVVADVVDGAVAGAAGAGDERRPVRVRVRHVHEARASARDSRTTGRSSPRRPRRPCRSRRGSRP